MNPWVFYAAFAAVAYLESAVLYYAWWSASEMTSTHNPEVFGPVPAPLRIYRGLFRATGLWRPSDSETKP